MPNIYDAEKAENLTWVAWAVWVITCFFFFLFVYLKELITQNKIEQRNKKGNQTKPFLDHTLKGPNLNLAGQCSTPFHSLEMWQTSTQTYFLVFMSIFCPDNTAKLPGTFKLSGLTLDDLSCLLLLKLRSSCLLFCSNQSISLICVEVDLAVFAEHIYA